MGKTFWVNGLLLGLSVAALPALAGSRVPGPGPFTYIEHNDVTDQADVHETSTPFLGDGIEPLGTFEIRGVKFKQKTLSRLNDHGDLCARDRDRLDPDDRETADRYCGTRVWAYRAAGQVFLFKADRQKAERDSALDVAVLTGTHWENSIGVREAQEGLSTTHVVRGFEVPASEIRRKDYLAAASRTNAIYAFCGATDPGQVVDTTARSIAWNSALIIFGGTLNPLYEIYVPKAPRANPQAEVTSLKIIQRETFSFFFVPSDFTTEYKLGRVQAP